MPEGSEKTATLRLAQSISDVPAADWDACAGADNPFLSHAFLSALEESQSVCPKTGWLPQHLLYEDADGRLVGAVPLYLKGHSYGEYIFDWGWADAYERAGGKYFPKLLSAVPFTPVTCPKLLVRDGMDRTAASRILAGGLLETARQHEVSSLHLNFPTETEWSLLGDMGFLQRRTLQYHWHNHQFATFDDFLATLNSRKRKTIRRERREVAGHGVRIDMLTGDAIERRHWDAFYHFYCDTSDRKWGSAYLNRRFFTLLAERMPDRVLLVMAEYQGQLVASALNLIGADTLYGRNWGCIADFKFLHFEACYYRAIDFAIDRGLARVEAGAGGTHKIQRGYLPCYTYSNHYITEARFRDAVEGFLHRETRHMALEKEAIEEQGPYRKLT